MISSYLSVHHACSQKLIASHGIQKGERGQIRSNEDKSPGNGTSTDQLVIRQPGLVPQIGGQLTNKCTNGATIFVDHASNLLYVHLMQILSGEETLESK
eukprot:9175839-Ditylum_brightwellii.AAC.1